MTATAQLELDVEDDGARHCRQTSHRCTGHGWYVDTGWRVYTAYVCTCVCHGRAA